MFYILVLFASVSLLERFLDRSAPTPKHGTDPLIYAAYFRKTQHVRVLLSRGASVNNGGWVVDGSCWGMPLKVAVERRHDKLVDLFLEEGSWVPEGLFDDALSSDKPIPLCIALSEACYKPTNLQSGQLHAVNG
ncbi:hypothetical protein BS17DRAFT_152941 [Gyrodon lividus]|nr:hypothetical protein BS17DRAFT_152941 [Gyrodon lividus]